MTVLVVKVGDEVRSCLGHPSPDRLFRALEEVDRSTLDLDDEQRVAPVEPDGIDGEEVRCEDAARLPAWELGPARTAPASRNEGQRSRETRRESHAMSARSAK